MDLSQVYENTTKQGKGPGLQVPGRLSSFGGRCRSGHCVFFPSPPNRSSLMFRISTLLRSLLLLLLMGAGNAFAQRNCGTMEVLQQEIQADPSRGALLEAIDQYTQQWLLENDPSAERNVITIPVVYHVVWRTTAENIPDARLLAQLQQLNEDFARLNADADQTPALFAALGTNTQIQFCLAQRDPSGNPTTGIVRRQTTVTSFSSNNAVKYTAQGGSNAWPRDSYLNIWTCNLSNSLLGYAQFPGGTAATDGVVVLHSSVGSLSVPGSASPFNFGRTLTHEVGHWLNLRHIWGDATCGNDQVADTPVHQTSNGGCPSFPKNNTCGGTTNTEMTMNYMDYSNDGCMNLFTRGQSDRMRALFGPGGSRVALLSSQGCVPPGGGSTCAVPTGLVTSAITTTSASATWGAVSGASSYDVQVRPTGGTWSTSNVTGTSVNFTGLVASTSYEWAVRANCSGAASAFSAAITFTTNALGCPDALEPNNSTTAAAAITLPASINALIASSSDADFYRFDLTATSNLSISLGNLAGDYDLRLLNAGGTQLAISQASGTTAESITFNNAAAGTYFIHVLGYNGAFSTTQCYTLNASATVVQTCNAPTGLAATNITTSGATLTWTAVSGATSYNVQYKLAANSTWTTVNSATNSLSLTGLTAGTSYNAQVSTVCSGSSSAYGPAITFTTAQPAGCTDTWESNNTSGTAKVIPVNTDIQALIGTSSDNDWYRFTNTTSQRRIRIDLTNLPADYDVRLFRGTSTQVGISQNSGTTNEAIVLNTTTVATYYIRVYGYNGAFNASQCYTLRASISGTNFREGEVEATTVETAAGGLLNLYPNPATDKVLIDYLAEHEHNVTLFIFDAMGRELLSTRLAVGTGPATYALPVDGLPNGMYLLHIQDGDQRSQQRFMIQR